MRSAGTSLPDRTRVAVIGGGIAGCSVAYHLARLGCDDVVLLERHELTSGSTWHAAGLCTQFTSNPHTMRMLKRSLDLYETLEQESGQQVGLHRCGSVRLAGSRDRVDQFEHVRGVAEQVGVPLEIITANEACALFPLMNGEAVMAAAYLRSDGHVDPSGVTNALAQGASARGVRIFRNTIVQALEHAFGGWRIETPRGTLRADVVMNAAGQWAPEIGRQAAARLPIVSLQHHYVVTEPLAEVRALERELPVLRDPEGSFYARQEGTALLVGPFEANPTPWAVDGIPEGFHGRLLAPRLEAIEDVLRAAGRRIPRFQTAGLKTLINGPDGYTPDGRALMGPVPGLPNFHVLAGFSIFGIVFGGGAGELAAEWILEGEPSDDVWELDVRRFGRYATARNYLLPKAKDAYTREYAIEFPHQERPVARQLMTSPVYDRLLRRGAVYGARSGWERPVWFDRGDGAREEYSYRRASWHDAVRFECEAVRDRVGVLDQTSFAKFEISGTGAGGYLDRLCANALPEREGKVVLTQMCTPKGGVECDVTVTRLGADRFYVVSAAATEGHDHAWLQAHLPEDGSVALENVTARYGVLTLAGPRSRELLGAVTHHDCSGDRFPFFDCRHIEVGMAPVRALRVSYVGELGFELHHPLEYQRHIYDQLVEAGESLGLVDFGYRALESMRLEKGYRLWGPDMSPAFTALEAGMERWVRFDKDNFIGRDALLEVRENGGPRKHLACLVIDADGADAHGFEPVRTGEKLVGFVTSGGYGFRVGRSIALSYLPLAACTPGTHVTVDILGQRRPAEVVQAPLYDPSNERLTA
jgi:dimethylglycine dehydrogenase